MAKKRRHKCPVCGLYLYGDQKHTGLLHDRIRAARRKIGRRRKG